MPAKVWRDNKFSSTECWVSGNDGRGLCQVCCLVRFTTYRGEPPLKACEKINRGWRVQSNSSSAIFNLINLLAWWQLSTAQPGGSTSKEASAVRCSPLMWDDPRDQVLLCHH